MASQPYPERRGGKCTGLWLMKYKTGGSWKVARLGRDARLTSARPPKDPPRAVLDRAREFEEIEYADRHGIKPAPNRAKSLETFVRDYVTGFAATRKPGSVRQLKRHADNFLVFARERGVSSIQGVTRPLCRDYLERLRRTLSFDTTRTAMRYLAPIWSRAVADEVMTVNPWVRLKVPGKSTKRSGTVWTSDEVGRIAAHCAKAWQAEFVLLLANTGLRISTALQLRWDWIDWAAGESGAIRIPAEAAAGTEGVKTAYRHLLSPHAHDLLSRRLAVFSPQSDLVFANPYGKNAGQAVTYDTVRAAIERAILRSGVRPGTAHDLRRTYATLLYRQTRDYDFVRRQLGHTSVVTTQRYIGIVEGDDARSQAGFAIGGVSITPALPASSVPDTPSPAPPRE